MTELAHLTTLENLDLSFNWLTGTPNIQGIGLFYFCFLNHQQNMLCLKGPHFTGCKGLSRLKRLKSIALADINFSSSKSIISCLKVLTSLKILDLSSSIGSESSVAIQGM